VLEPGPAFGTLVFGKEIERAGDMQIPGHCDNDVYFDEHNPPHFHVRYNEFRAAVGIQTLNVVSGAIPARVRGLVEEWGELHQQELLEMWKSQDFHKLTPLV